LQDIAKLLTPAKLDHHFLPWDAMQSAVLLRWWYRGGSPTAVQAWQPCPLWELSPIHPILL